MQATSVGPPWLGVRFPKDDRINNHLQRLKRQLENPHFKLIHSDRMKLRAAKRLSKSNKKKVTLARLGCDA